MTAVVSRADVVSSYTIIKGAMVEETYTVFQEWDFELSREDNLRRMRETNSIGASSENWLRDVSKVLHRRFEPGGRDRPLVELARAHCRLDVWKPLLLWHMTRDEFLLRDFLVRWLFVQHREGTLRIRTGDLHDYLRGLHEEGHVKKAWTETTLRRVASSLLNIATDLDLLRGTQAREFTTYHLPEPAFLYVLHAMSDHQPNAREVVHSDDWKMYLMEPDDVEREIFRLHQFRTLHYEVAGSIAQLSLPYPSAADYAKELAA
jgi:hypothetical protein